MSERRGWFGPVLGAVALIAVVVFLLLRNGENGDEEPPALVVKARQLQQERQWCDARDAWKQVLNDASDASDNESWRSEASGNIELLEALCSQPPALVVKARQLQQERQWCDARDAWKQVLNDASDASDNEPWRSEASGNIELCAALCEPPTRIPPGTRINVSPPQEAERPALISVEQLLKAYPQHRSVRGISDVLIKGQGSNRDWGLQGRCSFCYLAKVAVEATVESNDGRELTFLVHYPEVSQSLAVSRRSLELADPEMPVLSTVFGGYESLLEQIPVYGIIRKTVTLAQIVDPRLKQTLTWLVNQYDLQPNDEFELQAKLAKLSGRSFRISYRSGLGVTWIEDIDSGLFTQDELIRIAYSSSLLMDQYLVPTADKQVGDEWTVRVQDVASLLHLDGMTRESGALQLRREESPEDRQLWSLGVRGGDVDVTFAADGIEQEGHADIRSGFIHYDIDRHVVRDAKLTLEATTLWRTTDHLLFGTEDLKDVSIEASYQGERVEQPVTVVVP